MSFFRASFAVWLLSTISCTSQSIWKAYCCIWYFTFCNYLSFALQRSSISITFYFSFFYIPSQLVIKLFKTLTSISFFLYFCKSTFLKAANYRSKAYMPSSLIIICASKLLSFSLIARFSAKVLSNNALLSLSYAVNSSASF